MKKFLRILVPILLAIAIIASIGWYLFVYDRDFTRDTLLGQARYHDLHGNSRLSSWFYDLAFEYSGRSENVAIELANQYQSGGNYTKAEYTLTNAIYAGATTELYTALCKTYVAQDKLMDAANLLANVADPVIRAELEAARPAAPAADHEAGFYNQYIEVALSSDGGTLYCTTDGEYPSVAQEPYEKPLELPAGETMVYAICVGENGLVSPLSVFGYTVGGIVEPAVFTDGQMENAMRAAINANSSDLLYTSDLWAITEFTVPAGVTNFDDLALMPYLEKLTMEEQKLGSLGVLSSLNSLRELSLKNCAFPAADLSVPAALPSLTHLTLNGCGLSTIEGLTGAQELVYLDLGNNTVRNLEPLRAMTTLREIDLQHNAVTSLSALTELTNLEKLDVSFNALTSLSPIASCTKLSYLAAGNNLLTDLDGVNSLSLLSSLSARYNKITDVSILSDCGEIQSLDLSGNQIEDISALGNLSKLDTLDFSYNKVTSLPKWAEGCTLRIIDGSYNALESIDTLGKLSKIGYVYMDYNKLTNISALGNCYTLVQVNVFGNDIRDVSALTKHDIIVNFDPTKK